MLNDKKRIVAIVQARMTSTRLPGKILMDILSKPIIWHVVERIKKSKIIDEVVLAIPDNEENDILEKFAGDNGFEYFRGSEYDVLARHYLAAKNFGADIIVRIPSDNALIDPKIVDLVIEEHLKSGVDYTSNILKKTFPLGFHTEVFNFNALKNAFNNASKDYEKEHATPYIYEHPEIFKLQNMSAEGSLNRPELRLTVDTKEDFELISKIYGYLSKDGEMFGIEEVINLLDVHPELIEINADIKQKKLNEK